MGRYKAPRKFNFVSILIYLAIASGLYAAVQFSPVYYRKWQAKSVLSEAAARAYGKRVFHQDNIGDDERNEKLQKILDWTEGRMRALGIKDANLGVEIVDGSSTVTAKASYTERINHPLVGKTTVLYFRPWNAVSKDGG